MQLIIAFAVLGVLLVGGGWLLRPVPPARLRGVRTGGIVVLRPPRGRNAILAAMAIGPTLLVVVVTATALRKEEGIGVAGMVVVSLAVALGVFVFAYFLLAERKMQVRVTDRAVERDDPFRTQIIPWGQVEKLAYNGVSRWFFLAGPGGIRLWVPENMAGIGDFAEEALARVPPAVLAADATTREALEQLVAEMKDEDGVAGGASR